MSKINQLIQNHCPAGVEYKKLEDVLTIKNGRDYKQFGDGDVPVYGSGGIMTYINTAVYDKPSVLIPRKGSLDKLYYVDTPFWNVDTIFYTDIDTSLVEPKYIYYYLEGQHLERLNKAGGVPSLTQAVLNKVQLPIPPLEVQREIVRILDNFTLLKAELQAELQARKKQYEYYRDSLLSKYESVSIKSIESLCKVTAGGDAPKDAMSKDKTDEYKFPIISNGVGENALYGYTNQAKIMEPAVTVAARGTIGYAEYRDYPYFPIIRLLSLIPNDTEELDTKFLYYCLQGKKYNVPTTGIPQLTAPMLKQVEIPLPNISVQRKIVGVLDNFEQICNDLNIGLPAEIEARQKQYEYYRDALLSFDNSYFVNVERERERERER